MAKDNEELPSWVPVMQILFVPICLAAPYMSYSTADYSFLQKLGLSVFFYVLMLCFMGWAVADSAVTVKIKN